MKLHPAIDILDGCAVRLAQGDFERRTVYEEDPLQAARAFAAEGAEQLHVIDLDGARRGEPANLAHLRRISAEPGIRVQYGGGLRSAEAIAAALAAGAQRVILGTAAFGDPRLLAEALAEHGPERVLVSLDVRAGEVSTEGWTRTSGTAAAVALARLLEAGVREVVYTEIGRDGTLEGPDLDGLEALASGSPARLLYSGGIGSLAHLRQLAALALENLDGVIVGKALYERRFTVAEARAALAGA